MNQSLRPHFSLNRENGFGKNPKKFATSDLDTILNVYKLFTVYRRLSQLKISDFGMPCFFYKNKSIFRNFGDLSGRQKFGHYQRHSMMSQSRAIASQKPKYANSAHLEPRG